MPDHALRWIGWALQPHPILSYLLGFLVPTGLGYWFFALGPYRRGQTEALLSPWRVHRPAVPGVLEQYPAWEWVSESKAGEHQIDRLRPAEFAAGTETHQES